MSARSMVFNIHVYLLSVSSKFPWLFGLIVSASENEAEGSRSLSSYTFDVCWFWKGFKWGVGDSSFSPDY